MLMPITKPHGSSTIGNGDIPEPSSSYRYLPSEASSAGNIVGMRAGLACDLANVRQETVGSPEITRALYFECAGTAFERGFQKGLHDAPTLRRAVDEEAAFLKDHLDCHPEIGLTFPDFLRAWRDVASDVRDRMAHDTPTVYQELLGAAGAPGVDEDLLLMRMVEYDMYMYLKDGPGDDGKCTGIMWVGPDEDGAPRIIAEQTNDEAGKSAGAYDGVTAYRNPDGVSALVYSRSGVPGYMGINDNGVALLWQYIDDGRRDYESGVPTYALIREALTKPTAAEAVEFLKRTPHMVPNNFQVGSPDEGVYNVEVFPADPSQPDHPTNAVQWTQTGYAAHANHIVGPSALVPAESSASSTEPVDGPMQHDISAQVSVTSKARFTAAHVGMEHLAGNLNLQSAKDLLSRPPIWRDPATQGAALRESVTLASLVLTARGGEEKDGSIQIRLANDPDHEFREYGLSSGDASSP